MSNVSDATAERNLELFSDSEFAGFNDRDFDLLASRHADDVRVQMPDGRIVEGVEPHMAELKALLVWAPNLRVDEHITKVASGDWTAVVGILTGTFSQPMPLPDGTELAPTGRTVRIQVATFARWKDDQIVEESLFWDGVSFAEQLGIGG